MGSDPLPNTKVVGSSLTDSNMFKKLKQKLEEGGEGGLERVSFSEKLPGSIVRTTAANNGGPQTPASSEPLNNGETPVQEATYSEDRPDDQDLGLLEPSRGLSSSLGGSQLTSDSENNDQPWNSTATSDSIPSHLTSRPQHNYTSLLEVRVQNLEQECREVNKEMCDRSEDREREVTMYERRLAEYDSQVTDLKMQLMEAELERVGIQHSHESEVTSMRETLTTLQDKMAAQEQANTNTVQTLQLQLEQKEITIIQLENDLNDLRKKLTHTEGQLQAYENQSEDMVVSKLHSEVADVERRVQSRNIEIQILERRLAAQAKEKDGHYEVLIDRLENLEKQLREREEEVKTERAQCRSLQKDFDRELFNNRSLDKQLEQLNKQTSQQQTQNQLLQHKMEQLECEHMTQVQELEACLADKQTHIHTLSKQLQTLQTDGIPVQYVPRPPGTAHRTMSVAIQTVAQDTEATPTTAMPTTDSTPSLSEKTEIEHSSSTSANTGTSTSISTGTSVNGPVATSLTQELEDRQTHLEEELAEKMKIMKLQQQTILDLKKELRLQQKAREVPATREKSHSPSPPIRVAIASDVNFQYLKHVVIRFMCSHADEALQLTKAISTLLEFSPQEEQHVKNYLNYKMSWFGALPPPLFTALPTKQ